MFFYNNAIGKTLDYAESQGYGLLSKEDEFRLIKLAQAGDKDAEDELIYSNVKLVASCVSQFSGKTLTKEDLFQEGLFGLYDAIEKFDISLNYRFSTYATWLIKHRIRRTISNKDRVVRIPVYILDNISKIIRAEKDLAAIGVYDPTIKDISDITGLDEKNIKRAYENMDQAISIDTKIYGKDGSETTLEDYVSMNIDEVDQCEPFETICENTKKYDLIKVLKEVLTEREYNVLVYRYGLNDTELSLNEISKMFKVSEERIRQIERAAIQKLRNSKKAQDLLNYILN